MHRVLLRLLLLLACMPVAALRLLSWPAPSLPSRPALPNFHTVDSSSVQMGFWGGRHHHHCRRHQQQTSSSLHLTLRSTPSHTCGRRDLSRPLSARPKMNDHASYIPDKQCIPDPHLVSCSCNSSNSFALLSTTYLECRRGEASKAAATKQVVVQLAAMAPHSTPYAANQKLTEPMP